MLKDELRFKTIKVSQKGQISIPADIRKDLKIKEGEELLLIKKGGKIVLGKPEKFAKKIKNEDELFWRMLSQKAMERAWSKEDEIWDKIYVENK